MAGPTPKRPPPARPAAATTGGEPESRREAGKAERRARITQAARDLLRETGAADLSMRTLAERAGVSPATPYNLFGSKRAILVSVLDDIRGFGRGFATSAARPPFERILNAVALAVGYYEKDPEFYRVLWKTILGSDAPDDRSAIFNPRRDAFWTQLLQDAAEAGLLRAGLGLTGLRRALDASFRGTMLDWTLGELPTQELQRAVGFAYVLTLRGAASAQGLALLEPALQRLQPPPG